MNQAKILIFDIETAPSLAWVWKRFKENIGLDQVEQDGYVLCAAWKWLNESKITSVSNLEFDWSKPSDDKESVLAVWKALDEADIVVAHFGSKFDLPVMNARFVFYGLPPPSPYKIVDTKIEAAKVFKFPSNKLEGLARFFGVGKKHKTDFDLWKGCMWGDQSAWRKMVAYCRHDVWVLDKVYRKLRPFIVSHPNVNMFSGMTDRARCTKCGSSRIHWRGKYYRTQTQVYAAFQCQDCGAWGRGLKSQIKSADRKNLTAST